MVHCHVFPLFHNTTDIWNDLCAICSSLLQAGLRNIISKSAQLGIFAMSRSIVRSFSPYFVNALRSQFNWTQYRALTQIPDKDKREYYELESANNCWTARQTIRQINSQLYERLLLSSDKDAVLATARKE